MKCVDCPNKPSFICRCLDVYLCEYHLGSHIKRKHQYQELSDPFSDAEKATLKNELQKRIKALQKAIKSVHEQTKHFISQLLDLERTAAKKLNAQINSLIDLLKKKSYFQNDIDCVRKIIDTNLHLKQVAGIEGIEKCRSFFSQEFLEETKSEKWRREAFEREHHAGFVCGAVMSDLSVLVTGCEDVGS